MSKFICVATWDDCAHLTEEAKRDLYESLPPYQRDARSKGIPVLGAGAIYPVPESDYVIAPDFEIPDSWPRCFGFDVGWRVSAAVHAALSRDNDTLYIYSEYYRGEAEPVIHAEALKSRGAWIKGAIDPAARGRGQIDGRNLMDMYRDLGLDIIPAENATESGIYQVLTRLSSGRLKIFRSCQNLLGEMRLYRRDEKGRIVKERDHCVDAMRYMVNSLFDILGTKPKPKRDETRYVTAGYGRNSGTGWMG